MKKEIQNLGELESFLKQHNLTYPKHWKSLFKKKKENPKMLQSGNMLEFIHMLLQGLDIV